MSKNVYERKPLTSFSYPWLTRCMADSLLPHLMPLPPTVYSQCTHCSWFGYMV